MIQAVNIVVGVRTGAVFFSSSLCNVYACDVSRVVSSIGNDIETKAEGSFDLGFVFDMEAKRTCIQLCINFKSLYLKKHTSFLNEIFSESFCIHILLAQ